jgi:hypothetical protein
LLPFVRPDFDLELPTFDITTPLVFDVALPAVCTDVVDLVVKFTRKRLWFKRNLVMEWASPAETMSVINTALFITVYFDQTSS